MFLQSERMSEILQQSGDLNFKNLITKQIVNSKETESLGENSC